MHFQIREIVEELARTKEKALLLAMGITVTDSEDDSSSEADDPSTDSESYRGVQFIEFD